jgi:hypothetical protein
MENQRLISDVSERVVTWGAWLVVAAAVLSVLW